jgi:hypothetical protein
MGIAGGTEEVQVAEAWQANRAYLVDLAYGMVGDIGAAEDAVQEAFARLSGANLDEIEDKRGWLPPTGSLNASTWSPTPPRRRLSAAGSALPMPYPLGRRARQLGHLRL